MSDLQCPATFLVPASAEPRTLEGLRDTHLAAAYAVPEARARVSAALGESGPPVTELDLAGRTYAAALEGLADLHRGETVLVVLPEDAPATLSGRAEGATRASDEVLEVAVDADGWSVHIWTSASARRPVRD
jgi:hypothetical protein